MNFNGGNSNKRYFDNSDNSGPPFKRQRGSFRGNQNFNNSGRSNFNRGRGSFPGRQNFNRGGRGPYHGGGQNFIQGGRGRGGGGGGRGSFRGQRGGFFPRGGRFNNRGSFPRNRGGSFRNTSPRKSENNNVIEVSFPNIKGSYKDIFTQVLDNCDMILRPRPISSSCSLEDVKDKMALMKEITIDGNKLHLTVSSSSMHPSKKTIQLPEKFASQAEKIKEFFAAEEIEQVKSYKEDRYIPMHILTFSSEKAARDASAKIMTINHFNIGLKPYYNVETLYSDAEEKTDMDSFDEKAKAILEKNNVDEEVVKQGKSNVAEEEVSEEQEDDGQEAEEENQEGEEDEQEAEEDEQGDDDENEEEEDEQEEKEEDEDDE